MTTKDHPHIKHERYCVVRPRLQRSSDYAVTTDAGVVTARAPGTPLGLREEATMPEPSAVEGRLLFAPCAKPATTGGGPIAGPSRKLHLGHNWGITGVSSCPLLTRLPKQFSSAYTQVRRTMVARVTSRLRTQKLIQILSPRLAFMQVKGPLPTSVKGLRLV